MFLSSDINRAYVHFLLSTLPIFEESNLTFQANHLKIHVLKDLILAVLKCLLSHFVIPDVVKESASLLDVNYKAKENQKEDSELVIGEAASNIISTISEKKKSSLF